MLKPQLPYSSLTAELPEVSSSEAWCARVPISAHATSSLAPRCTRATRTNRDERGPTVQRPLSARSNVTFDDARRHEPSSKLGCPCFAHSTHERAQVALEHRAVETHTNRKGMRLGPDVMHLLACLLVLRVFEAQLVFEGVPAL